MHHGFISVTDSVLKDVFYLHQLPLQRTQLDLLQFAQKPLPSLFAGSLLTLYSEAVNCTLAFLIECFMCGSDSLGTLFSGEKNKTKLSPDLFSLVN